jgi:hypothetical protein
MKSWNKINWPAVKARRALKLKIEAGFWRGSSEQDTLKEKGRTIHRTPADRTTVHALMVWSDDGGTAALGQLLNQRGDKTMPPH